MRLYSVVPTPVRRATQDYVVPGHPKFVIEKNTSILIPSFAIHHDPEIYPNPNEFNPDNFEPSKVVARDSVTWLPFGDGPRNCIGLRFGQMQTRLGIAILLKDYKFLPCDSTQIPVKIDKSHHLCINEGGINLKVEKV